ncbi:phosphoglycerate dehydrogenase [Jingyaoa shaoxingensis]|uniref:Phosphoglycerate dehydrogenase n=1 Tax=Jingyaoa shaoxingensis TaxID=2763671 RepID=A0ABR7N8U0_9FIRM|nr:phosphoglycerate dehydrogenase [Jingyaoa shaoxingensis]MBC8572744.1 phosphoglycerate dehydrogenase [Jingyaoa shaoxingensis]
MGKILVSASHFDTLCKDAWELLEKNGHEVIYDKTRSFPAYSFEELKDIIGDIDAAIIGMDKYTEEVFEIAPKLKAVAKFGVGVDNIDLVAAKKHGVKALNAPGQNSNAVAELTVCYILDMLRKVIPIHEELKEGNWPRWIGSELRGKTVGLVGFGAIARLVAKKLQGFDVQIKAYDLYMNQKLADELGVKACSLDEIVETSDVVSLHIPVSDDTYHMFNTEMFMRMKKGSYLVNAARGGLVDLDDLTKTLREGQIAGAALDAFEMEPLPKGMEIFNYNVVCTPHIGAESFEAYRDVSLCVSKDIIRVLAGEEPEHCVNR